MTTSPQLITAVQETRGLLAALVQTAHLHNFSQDQVRLIERTLGQLRAAVRRPVNASMFDFYPMDHPDIAQIKANATRILVYVPRKKIPKDMAKTKVQVMPPRWLISHWSQAAQLTSVVTPSEHSIRLTLEHGGFWASDGRGIKPIKGAPTAWTPLPLLDGEQPLAKGGSV